VLTNTFFSQEGRSLFAKMPASVEQTWALAFALDNALLDHKIVKWLAMKDSTEKAIEHLVAAKSKRSTRNDSPGIDLTAYEQSYRFICERYLQRDLDRPNAIRVARICERYPYAKIVRVTRDIAGRSHVPLFLDSCLSSAPDDDLDNQRKDAEVQALIGQSRPVRVPPKRFPGLMVEAMKDARVDDEIGQLIGQKTRRIA
jgi:hypothetical protein